MPIVRVPVVHKFGIVSVARAEQLLQEGRRGKRDTATPRLDSIIMLPTTSLAANDTRYTRHLHTACSERGWGSLDLCMWSQAVSLYLPTHTFYFLKSVFSSHYV